MYALIGCDIMSYQFSWANIIALNALKSSNVTGLLDMRGKTSHDLMESFEWKQKLAARSTPGRKL